MKKSPLIPKEVSNLQKTVTSVQKLLAKEMLFLFIILILAIPTAFVLAYLLAFFNEESTKEVFENIVGSTNESGGKGSFIVLYVISVIGLYFTKLIIQSVRLLVKKDEEE